MGRSIATCLTAVTLSLFAASIPLLAQQTGSIQGSVVNASTREPLSGALVQIVGTGTGQIANDEGRFLLVGIPTGTQQVRVTYVGYRSDTREIEVTQGQVAQIEFALGATQIQLDEIVVTGTAAPTERRQLGQTITSITSAELEGSPITSITDALQGRVAGMAGLPMGETGAAGKLLLRGTSSLSQRNEPLIYIDGIRVDNNRTSVAGVAWDRLGDINPSDVERIEVIKGAAAATLFGTEASSGVIQIFTKRGTVQPPVFTLQIDQEAIHLPNSKWPENVQYNPTTGIVQRQRPSEDFVEVGYHQNYSLSVRGGSEGIQYFVSGRVLDEDAPMPNNGLSTASLRSGFDFRHGDRLRSAVDLSVVRSSLEAPQPDWSSVASDFLLSHPIRASENDPHGRTSTGEFGIADLLNDRYDSDASNVLVSGSLTYDFSDALVGALRVGHNDIRREDIRFRPEGVVSPTSRGLRRVANVNSTTTTVDARVTWDADLTDRIRSNLTLGGQSFWEGTTNQSVQVQDFASPTLKTLRGGSTISSVDEFQTDVINAGFFFQEQIGIDDRLFLTAGLRMDGNSAFGENFGLQAYPKAGFSWVLSDYDFWNVSWMEEFRLRGAIGTSGLQPGAFDAQRTWQPGIFGGGVPQVTPLNVGNEDLKPERSVEREVGLEAGLFGGRMGLEAVYFNQTTQDALLPQSQVPSSGFTSTQLINIGEVTSQGIELTSNFRVMDRGSFGWDMTAAYTWIDQEVTDMGGVPDFRIEGRRRWGWIAEGHRPGVVIAPIQDPDQPYTVAVPVDQLTTLGQIQSKVLANPDGSEKLVVLGNSLPSWTVDMSSTFRVGEAWTLRALFTGAGGFIMSNETEILRGAVRINEFTAVREAILQDPTSTTEERQRVADEFGRRHPDVVSSYMEDGDWLKLNELSISYQVPNGILENFGLRNTTVSLGGRNLVRWTKYSGILDPGTSGGGFTGVSEFLQNVDYISAPSPRRYVLTLRTSW
jgi:outer membrane receptor protein involved in Fe transport